MGRCYPADMGKERRGDCLAYPYLEAMKVVCSPVDVTFESEWMVNAEASILLIKAIALDHFACLCKISLVSV